MKINVSLGSSRPSGNVSNCMVDKKKYVQSFTVFVKPVLALLNVV